MTLHRLAALALAAAPLTMLASAGGCEEKKPTPTTSADDHGHDHNTDDHGHDHSADDHGHDHNAGASHPAPTAGGPGHGGSVIALGEQTIGAFNAKATRDQGEIVAGKDAPIDVTVMPAPGSTAKVAAVRFWIGTEDAKGSVKARAEVENPTDPSRWHTHAEVPSPLPAESRLWVEIEDDKGATTVSSFDLKV
ncbi:MAG: hypothetical protein SFY69_04475 [Planctomycetota bacterium]|nr:hypothetical protein [Planctomycetota bacterium]